MTPEERKEWTYRRDERLGVLCGTAEPTAEQTAMAEAEAHETILALKGELNLR